MTFNERIVQVISDCKVIGYTPPSFISMRNEYGTVETVRRLINRTNTTSGYIKLLEMGRLDLTLESVIQEPEWKDLFTQKDRNFAKKKL
jgi:hypothetical protein